jgi:hypothetical protein
MSTYWNATRARNFVKEMGYKPTNFTQNMQVLAKIAGVTLEDMQYFNPVSFARNFGVDCRIIPNTDYYTLNLARIEDEKKLDSLVLAAQQIEEEEDDDDDSDYEPETEPESEEDEDYHLNIAFEGTLEIFRTSTGNVRSRAKKELIEILEQMS